MFKPLYNPTTLTCSITIGDWEPCEGIQKIIGFSRGWHHRNSIRLGYNRDSWESPVRLFMYAYVNGKLIDPKECVLGLFDVGAEIFTNLEITKTDYYASVVQKQKAVKWKQIKFDSPRVTLPIGYLLGNYAELDGPENEQIAFKVDIKDLKVNGKNVKIK